MSPTLLVILVSIAAVALFALGISLTLIFKGHNIDSEIGDNKNMRARGIKCAAEEMRQEEKALGLGCAATSCKTEVCGSCSEPHTKSESSEKPIS